MLANTKNLGQNRDTSGRYTTTRKTSGAEPLPEYTTTSAHTAIPTNVKTVSSYSSFDILENTQSYTSTPFESTPDGSPIKAPIPLPSNTNPPSPSTDIMSNEHVAPFHGDNEDENPEDFIRSFFRRMGMANDEVKKQQFPNFLQADSVADEWFEELVQEDKKDWAAILVAFRKR